MTLSLALLRIQCWRPFSRAALPVTRSTFAMVMCACGLPPSESRCTTTSQGEFSATSFDRAYAASATIPGVAGSSGSSSAAEKLWMIISAWFLRPLPRSIDSMDVIASYGFLKSERYAAARDCLTFTGLP